MVLPGSILEVTEAWYGGGGRRRKGGKEGEKEKKEGEKGGGRGVWVDVTAMIRLLVRDGGVEPMRVRRPGYGPTHFLRAVRY